MLLLVTFSCLLLRPCSSLHPGAAAEGGNVTASQRALSVFSVVKVRRAAACACSCVMCVLCIILCPVPQLGLLLLHGREKRHLLHQLGVHLLQVGVVVGWGGI